MGGGTDVARASGDLILIHDELGRLPATLALAQRTMHIIRQNLWWAALYNLLALPLAIAGWVTPWLASLGMALSSLLVVGNALRLIKRDK
ncbi:Copper-exporting P-type ATPase A [compost metagenome]